VSYPPEAGHEVWLSDDKGTILMENPLLSWCPRFTGKARFGIPRLVLPPQHGEFFRSHFCNHLVIAPIVYQRDHVIEKLIAVQG
jgi:hypothetical protein